MIIKKISFFICNMLLVVGVGLSQTPANDAHWGTTGSVPAVPKWYDDFKNISKSGGYIANWEVLNNFDHGGETHVYIDANTTTDAPSGVNGLKLTAQKQNYLCTADIQGGSYYSADNGTSWTQINNGLSNLYINAFTISGSNLFAATSGSGIFYSGNNGATWTATNNGINSSYLNIQSLAISGSNLFAGTNGGGVYYSTNNGANWTVVNSGLSNLYIHALAISGSNLFAGTSGGGAFKSTNNGSSWTAINSGLSNLFVNAIAVNGSNVFVGTIGGGVFYSANSGSSWTAVNSGLSNLFVNTLAISGSSLFAGTNGGGVFYSTNNGSSWTAVNSGINGSYLNIQSLAISGSNLFAGTNGGGVYYSANNGISWTLKNSSPLSQNVHALVISGANLFAGATSGGAYPDHHYVAGCVSSAPDPAHGYDTLLGANSRLVRYGYIEAKIKLSNTFGLWSAFWLWNCGRTGGCSYDNDEVDIFEMIPGKKIGEPCSQFYTRQGDKYLFSSGIPISQTPPPMCSPTDYLQLNACPDYTVPHTYGLEWSPSKLIWYIDGQIIRNTSNPGYPNDPNGNISQAMRIILGAQISSYVNWDAGSPIGYYDASYNDRSDYSNYFSTSYPYIPSGQSVNRATSYSNPPISGPVNLNTIPSDMYVEYVKYWRYNPCSGLDQQINTSNINSFDKSIDKSYTITSASPLNLPSSKIWRATDNILINGDFYTNGYELYLDANPCPKW